MFSSRQNVLNHRHEVDNNVKRKYHSVYVCDVCDYYYSNYDFDEFRNYKSLQIAPNRFKLYFQGSLLSAVFSVALQSEKRSRRGIGDENQTHRLVKVHKNGHRGGEQGRRS